MSNYLTYQFKAMGSVCEFKLYIPERVEPSLIFRRLEHEVRQFENKYTRYKPDSVTSRINTAAGTGEFIEIDEETSSLLNYADTLFEQSDGMFDITSGILRQAWNFSSQTLPSEEKLQSILPKIGWQKVERKNKAVRLPLAGMEIDFGGYVKEYVADVCATLCIELQIYHGLINLGGDVRIVGPHPNGESWKVGIQHPRIAGSAIATIDVPQGAIATSGDYERYMLVDGKRYCHILNPASGHSIQPWYSGLSVVAEQCLVAGSFSTIGLIKSCDNPDWIGESGLPWLGISQNMEITGTVDLSCPSPKWGK